MINDQEQRLAGLLCNIDRRLNLRGGSELEYVPTLLGLMAAVDGRPILWSDRAASLSTKGQKFPLTSSQRSRISSLVKEIKRRLYAHHLDYKIARPLLTAIADNRVVIRGDQPLCLRKSTEANPLEEDEFLFRNSTLADVFALPITAVVAQDSKTHRVLKAYHIDTLGGLLYLSETELKKFLYISSKQHAKMIRPDVACTPLPPEQVAGLLCELDRRGLHLTRLDKTQPPDSHDRWIHLTDTNNVAVLASQAQSTTINPIRIEWLLGQHDRHSAALLHDLGVHTLGQLLQHTEQSLRSAISSRTNHQYKQTNVAYRVIVTQLARAKLELATKPTVAV